MLGVPPTNASAGRSGHRHALADGAAVAAVKGNGALQAASVGGGRDLRRQDGTPLRALRDRGMSTVEITTLTVTINALRIGTKQMTQAVYKQLPYGRPLDGDGRLLVPSVNIWGRINYCGADDCYRSGGSGYWYYSDKDATGYSSRAQSFEHLHFVYENDGTLYRSGLPTGTAKNLWRKWLDNPDLRSVPQSVVEIIRTAPQLFIAV